MPGSHQTATEISNMASYDERELRKRCLEWALMYQGHGTAEQITAFADKLLAYVKGGVNAGNTNGN